MYVQRDDTGRIVSVSLEENQDCREAVDSQAPELAQFCQLVVGENDTLAKSDLPMVRVLEDLIELLVSRGVIRFTDFPEEAQHKLLERLCLRERSHRLCLFGDEAEDIA
ncbi:MAG: tryptophan synthase subunit beta like protein [Desulfuromonas sp.]|nr:MAG: tryptophan synthase subunit beta like protein [Desulfuromonas sp.]